MSPPKMQLCSPAKSEVTRVHITVKTHIECHHKAMWKKRMRSQVPARPPLDHILICMFHSFIIHLPSEEYLGYFQILTIMKKTAVNICVKVFLWTFYLLWVITKV